MSEKTVQLQQIQFEAGHLCFPTLKNMVISSGGNGSGHGKYVSGKGSASRGVATHHAQSGTLPHLSD